MSTTAKIVAAILLLAAVIACILLLGMSELTGRESALLSVVLTTMSVLATWILTHVYAELHHKRAIAEVQEFNRANLRTYAAKAAEKVRNLSQELGRLGAYLQDEIDSTEYGEPAEALQAKEERLTSAVHIINTLRSVNDTALSDWQGVIGDILDEQREAAEQHERELAEMLDDYQDLVRQVAAVRDGLDSTEPLATEIAAFRADLRSLAWSLGRGPLDRRSPYDRTRNLVDTRCPECGGDITYRQKSKESALKAVTCKACGTRLIARYGREKGHFLEERRAAEERVSCPECGVENRVLLDTFPSGFARVRCSECHVFFMVTRGRDEVRVRRAQRVASVQGKREAAGVTEGVLQTVQKALPDQPWPKGVHRDVAQSVGLPAATVSSAISELIRRGVFNPQVDGRVYLPAQAGQPSSGRKDEAPAALGSENDG